jgi:hypothetical protein
VAAFSACRRQFGNDGYLFEQIAYEGQHSEVTGAFNGSCHAALVLQAIAGNAAGENFALFVDELEQEFGVFVINVLDTEFAEAAIFLATQPDFGVAQEFNIFS